MPVLCDLDSWNLVLAGVELCEPWVTRAQSTSRKRDRDPPGKMFDLITLSSLEIRITANLNRFVRYDLLPKHLCRRFRLS
jgi:hypothetical protein